MAGLERGKGGAKHFSGRPELAQQFPGQTRAKPRRQRQRQPIEGSIQFHANDDATTVSLIMSSCNCWPSFGAGFMWNRLQPVGFRLAGLSGKRQAEARPARRALL